MASRSLYQMPMEGRVAPALGLKEAGQSRREGLLVQVVIDSGKGARAQACSGHEP